jgi:hypothetical protein
MIVFNPFNRRIPRFIAALALLALISIPVRAEDIKVEARLIWGCDTETNITNATIRKVEDTRLIESLSKTFKWKNYYQITNCAAVIAGDAIQSLKMSAKCTLKVKNMGAGKVEVECYGDDKFVSKTACSLADDKWLTLGGPDKDKNAWFIVLRSRNPKGGDKD